LPAHRIPSALFILAEPLDYSGQYWPEKITSVTDAKI